MPEQMGPEIKPVPMYDESMNQVMVNPADVHNNLAAGYTFPTPEEVNAAINEDKYGGVGEQLKTFAEGAGEAATFGLSTGAERAAGVSPEAIQGRREQNPITHAVGQVAGLVGSQFIPGLGAANLMERAGVAGAKALIPGAEAAYEASAVLKAAKAADMGSDAIRALRAAREAQPFVAKAGSMAADQAIQFAMMQSGDEVSKMFSGAPGYEDPGAAVQTALTNIGLSTVLGGATGFGFGAVSPLWKATVGDKLENVLMPLRSRANAETAPVVENFEQAVGGLKMPAEVKAKFSDNPEIKKYYDNLIESGTQPGLAIRQASEKYKEDVVSGIKSMFNTGDGLSAYDAGLQAKDAIATKAEELNAGIRARYDAIADTTNLVVPDEARVQAYEHMIAQGQRFGSTGSPAEGLFRNYADRFLAQETIGQQDKLITELNSEMSMARRAGDFEKSRALGQIKENIRDFQDVHIGNAAAEAVGATAGSDAAEHLILQRKEARAAYAEFMDQISEISGAAKLGKVKSFGQLQEALDKIEPAKLANNLFKKDKIDSLNMLKEQYPEVFGAIVKQQKTSLLESSIKGEDFMHNTLIKKYQELPKEIKNLMFTDAEQKHIEAATSILRESAKRTGPSGTPRTLDELWKHMPAGIGGIASVLTGHNPLVGVLVGELGKYLARDVPDAIKLSLLKYLGSTGPIDGQAWKIATDFIEHTYRGAQLVEKSAKNVFNAGTELSVRGYYPEPKEREKLDRVLQEIQGDPEKLVNVGGNIAHYLPDHGMSIAQTSSTAVNYLNGLRPSAEKQNPLDSMPEISADKKAAFNRALDIAERPLAILSDVKNGTITPQDISHLNTLYPSLYGQLKTKLMSQMIDATDKEVTIPYKTKLGLSLFLGQPLDSTMTPQAIQAVNSAHAVQGAQNQQQQVARHTSMKDLGKIGEQSATTLQKREAARFT